MRGRRAVAACAALLAGALLLVGCGAVAPTDPVQPVPTGGPEPAPGEPAPDPAAVDLAAYPERIAVAGRLTEVLPAGLDSQGFLVLRTGEGLLPVVLRFDAADAGGAAPGALGSGGEPAAGPGRAAARGAEGVLVAAPAGFVLPEQPAAAFAALERLAAETGGALQAVALLGEASEAPR